MERGGRRKRPCFPGYSKQFLRCDKRNSDRPSSSAEVWRNVARNARPETACPRSNTRLPCIQAASLNSSTHYTAFFSLHTFPVRAKNRECRGRVPGGPGFESRSGDGIMIEVYVISTSPYFLSCMTGCVLQKTESCGNCWHIGDELLEENARCNSTGNDFFRIFIPYTLPSLIPSEPVSYLITNFISFFLLLHVPFPPLWTQNTYFTITHIKSRILLIRTNGNNLYYLFIYHHHHHHFMD
jgi:hypothetical protein